MPQSLGQTTNEKICPLKTDVNPSSRFPETRRLSVLVSQILVFKLKGNEQPEHFKMKKPGLFYFLHHNTCDTYENASKTNQTLITSVFFFSLTGSTCLGDQYNRRAQGNGVCATAIRSAAEFPPTTWSVVKHVQLQLYCIDCVAGVTELQVGLTGEVSLKGIYTSNQQKSTVTSAVSKKCT